MSKQPYMNNERYNQIIDEAYENYRSKASMSNDLDCLVRQEEGSFLKEIRLHTQEEFINKCKTDVEFSERWGLKIEERELRFEERYDWYINTHNKNITRGSDQYDMGVILNTNNCPTKLITVTYKDEKIEVFK
jgi:hypothetical protein